MAERSANAAASRKVELAIGGLDALSVPPCVAVQYLSKISDGRFAPRLAGEIIACEPALTAMILSLAQRTGAGPTEQRHAVPLVLDRLEADAVRDGLLGVRVSAGFEIEFAAEQPARPARTDLILHSLAVACAAKRIAQDAVEGADPHLAYSAGLLHDIGKLALQDIMPKSLAAIAMEAEAAGESLYSVEQMHLGTNHAVLGRQLAQRWGLPDSIVMAIWLHHSAAVTRLEGLPETQVARLVWAADHIVRHLSIGCSGSFDAPEPLSALAEVIGAETATLQEIREVLPEEVAAKADVLGLDTPSPAARYCDLVQDLAAQLSGKQTELAGENRTLKASSTYLDFAQGFLQEIGPEVSAIGAAGDLARRWQRFFQTGTVCLYLDDSQTSGMIETVIVEALGHSHKLVLQRPEVVPIVPRGLAERFAVLDAERDLDWLIEQVDVDFDLTRTKLVPLLSQGRAIAVMAFELNYPGDAALFAEKFETAAGMAGAVLGLALAKERQVGFSERLIRAMGRDAAGRTDSKRVEDPMAILAEMAAGVAHELNNPLSVISGRAQLLAEGEEEQIKQRDLKKIQENAQAVSEVIDDLMSFAEPSAPRPATIDIRQIVEEAIQLAGQKSGIEHINAQVQTTGPVRDVFVDSGQVVSALANVIANAVEAYPDAEGPIKVLIDVGRDTMHMEISDLGSGMDESTQRRAMYPFFSAKPAGRQRGMGLANATRLVHLNGGTLTLQSQPEHGTTVTITLPYE